MGLGQYLWMGLCYIIFAVCCVDVLTCLVVGSLGGIVLNLFLALLFCPLPGYREWKYRQFAALFGKSNDPRDELNVIHPEDIPPLVERESAPVSHAVEPAKPELPSTPRVSPIPGAVFAPLDEDGLVVVPTTAAGIPIAYHYKDVNIYTPDRLDVDLTQVDLGLRVTFRFEPDNPYDKKAVAVYVGEWKIGYMKRGKIRDMLIDWVGRKHPFWACITGIDDEEREIYILLAFYRESRRSAYEDLDDDDNFDYDA